MVHTMPKLCFGPTVNLPAHQPVATLPDLHPGTWTGDDEDWRTGVYL